MHSITGINNLFHFEFMINNAIDSSLAGGRIEISFPKYNMFKAKEIFDYKLGTSLNSGANIPCKIINGLAPVGTDPVACYLYFGSNN